jgi:SHS2 domain-containing protein
VTWRTFEHQADLGLDLNAEDGPALFAQAAQALTDTLFEPGTVAEGECRDLHGEAPDAGALLVDWLNDLLFLAETGFAFSGRVEMRAWSETAYGARVHGEALDPVRHAPRGLVKAATYHGLEVARTESGWRARVILDV